VLGDGGSNNDNSSVKGGNVNMGGNGIIGDIEEQGERHGGILINLFASEVNISINFHHCLDLNVGLHHCRGSKPYSSISCEMNSIVLLNISRRIQQHSADFFLEISGSSGFFFFFFWSTFY
jgi:hypothetical protein